MTHSNSYNWEMDEWNYSQMGDYLWSNVNFGEAVTETMTPLTWSVIRFTLEDWIFLPGFPTVGNIGGLPYLNISIFATLFRLLGRSQSDLLKYMQATLYMRLPQEMQIPLIRLNAKTALSGLLSSAHIRNRQRYGIRNLPVYLETNLAWFQQMRLRIQKETSKTSLETLWKKEIKPHIKDGVWTVLGTASYSSEYTLKLWRTLAILIGDEDASTLISNISSESGTLPSLEPLVGIAKVARGELSRTTYLAQFGHRGPHEFELSKPRPSENPLWLDQELENFLASPVDIDALIEKQRTAFKTTWQRLVKNYPRQAKKIQDKIRESARRTWLREHARSAYTRDRWLIRIFASHIAKLTGIGDDVFFLHLDEVLSLLQGDGNSLSKTPSRRAIYERYKLLPPYPSLIRGHFNPEKWAADPNRRSDLYDEQKIYPDKNNPIIHGAAGSTGQVEGMVRRLDNATESMRLQPGEILVTTQTDISWTPIFPKIAAVVTDMGAPLSHAAIVARELGIPAVVGCGDATMRLKTGDRVHVDGSKGTVTIIQ